MVTFVLNGEARAVDIDPNTPLPWVIRDSLQLTGTKYGCGIGQDYGATGFARELI